MRISILSDLHYPISLKDPKELDSQPWREADVLVLAGDLVNNYNQERLTTVFEYFSSFLGEKLFVAGNHELWTTEDDPDEIYRKELKLLADIYGFHYLDDSPKILGNVGFVGNIGWYDYSFAPDSFTLPDGVVLCEEKVPNTLSFQETDKRWENLGPDSFSKKLLAWNRDGRLHLVGWNDRAYVRWKLSDEDFLKLCLNKIRNDLEEVSNKVEKIVVVTHHVPFAELLDEPKILDRAFCQAFMGSKRIGELFYQYPRVKLCISGHAHYGREIMAGSIKAVSIKSSSLFQAEI